MNDKTKLIQSMTNLIYHVSTSRKNQQQIFSTLSQTDIKKILNNLEDSNQKLRKTTLILLAQLLYENIGLQKKFCQMTSIPANAGKIVLSYNFPKEIIADGQSVLEVFRALKDQINLKQRGLFWYIDSQSKTKVLQIGQRNTTVDPLNCIVGVWILEQNNYYINVNYQQSINNSNRGQLKINQQIDKTNLLSPKRVDLKNINPLNGKVRLNRSEQLQKSNQVIIKPQTPLKFVSNADREKYSLTAVVPRTKQYNYNQINYIPIYPTTQIKPFIQPEIKKIINYPQRQNSQPINMQIDNIKYVRANNYSNQIITPINSMSTVNSLNSTTNVTFGVNRIQPLNTYDGGMQNKIHVFYNQNMREPRIQFRKHQ